MKTLNTPVKEGVMGKFLNRILFAIMVSALVGIVLDPSDANASLGVCATCHVMHASQVATGGTATTPLDYLLKADCLGCHTGTNSTDGSAPTTPFIYDSGAASLATSLAGGNFKFVDSNDRFGHNPSELGSSDATLTGNPPGWKASGFAANGQVGTAWGGANRLSCAGTYGCHGVHTASGVNGAHHANTTGALTSATTVANSYRFLYKIMGYEADDYEYNPSATTGDHNVYYGKARTGGEASGTGDDPTDTQTISYLCAECHGIFHSGSGSNEGISDVGDTFFTSPWIRHPVDIDMPTSGEYTAYSTYVPGVPVASSSVADGALTVSNAGDRIVMCLSCHFGHAGPYPADLRWDASTVIAGGGSSTTGCFACHSTKDI